MELRDFRVGGCFYLGGRKYLCTDIGARTVAAICLSGLVVHKNGAPTTVGEAEARRNGWLNGPPYPVQEQTLDECDIEACTKQAGTKKHAAAVAGAITQATAARRAAI